jgi:hypothetical protein
MGDRISISFRNGKEESVALFSHSDGKTFLEIVDSFLLTLTEVLHIGKHRDFYPLSRLEPQTVMFNFIVYLQEQNGCNGCKFSYSNYYLGKDKTDGDNSDNGHYIIDLNKTTEVKESITCGATKEGI